MGNTLNLVTAEGLKEMTVADAMVVAEKEGMDLILVNDEKNIYKLGDYSRMMYEKKQKAQKKGKAKNDLKMIQLSPNIAPHDLKIKVDKVNSLLRKGVKVKVIMQYKGRMRSRIANGVKLVRDIAADNGWELETTVTQTDGNVQCTVIGKRW